MKLQIKSLAGSILFESEAESIMYGADLYGADLRGADLSGANLGKANLYGADLRWADLYGADLYGAKGLLDANIPPLQIQGTRDQLIVRERGHITIGCMHHPIEHWEKHYQAIGKSQDYSKEQINEYRNYIALARYWMKLHGVLEPTKKDVAA